MTSTIRQVPVGTARVSARAAAYVAEVLASGRLSPGPFSARFEAMMAEAHGVGAALFCNSGTSALQCALAALREVDGWRDDDEVIVPAVSFVASANVVLTNRLRPRFVDVDARTFGIDPDGVAAAVGPRTRAIMVAHLFGLPCDMAPIMAVAKRHGLRVVEDSCETMFVAYRGRPVGSFGDLACFSTRASHLVSTGIGGFVCTSDVRLAAIVRSLIHDGRAEPPPTGAHERPAATGHFVFERIGFNYRASELEAALGVAQLEERSDMLATRRRHAASLTSCLADVSRAVQLPWCPPDREHAFAMFPLVLHEAAPARATVVAHLAARGIESRALLPLVSQPVYRRLHGDLLATLPEARRLDERGFYVGCHDGLDDADVAYLAETITAVLRTPPPPDS
jgi:dTDP-4-amino-4,6-dideoxygalactose transaminase